MHQATAEIVARAVFEQTGLVPFISEASSDTLYADVSVVCSARTGDLDALFSGRSFEKDGSTGNAGVGAGVAEEFANAALKAVAESLERYATAVFLDQDVVRGSASALRKSIMGGLPLTPLHVRESRQSAWALRAFNPDAIIRWVPGYDLVERREVLVPLVMAHIFVAPEPGEQFWVQNTAGVSAHTTIEAATEAALFELVERDAVETIWALRVPLPRLDVKALQNEALTDLAARDEAIWVDQAYYDASRDTGVPTVYGVRRLKPPVGHDVIVTCAAASSIAEAALKVRLDAGAQQARRSHEVSGQVYTRFPNQLGRLVSDPLTAEPDLTFLDVRAPRRMPSDGSSSVRESEGQLSLLVRRLAKNHPNLIALNLTTDETRRLGLHIVRVLAPSLAVPTLSPLLAYLDHPRLAVVAAWAGLRVPSAATVNLEDQPFS